MKLLVTEDMLRRIFNGSRAPIETVFAEDYPNISDLPINTVNPYSGIYTTEMIQTASLRL